MLKLFWASVLLVEADEITHKGYTFSSKLKGRHWTGVPKQSSTEMKLLKNDVKEFYYLLMESMFDEKEE